MGLADGIKENGVAIVEGTHVLFVAGEQDENGVWFADSDFLDGIVSAKSMFLDYNTDVRLDNRNEYTVMAAGVIEREEAKALGYEGVDEVLLLFCG